MGPLPRRRHSVRNRVEACIPTNPTRSRAQPGRVGRHHGFRLLRLAAFLLSHTSSLDYLDASFSGLRIMKPAPFFLGLFCGLICLSYLGSHVVSDEWARQFTRFQRSIHSESNYFPTIRQLTQILDAGDTSKIAVVIRGTSVLHGTGQHDSLMWTRQLQQNLGPSFRVFNFAQRGARANDFGNIAAEILIERKAPGLYVADGMPLQFPLPYTA